jgi:beta-1,4-N-acetylglucosaminyltransferase
MILVMTGTSGKPFDRLLRMFERVPLDEAIVMQCGPSKLRLPGTICVPYLPVDQLDKYVRDARVVVSHAGVGSVSHALKTGKRPVIVPRLRRFGEAVDDHQLTFARRLHDARVATMANNGDELLGALQRVDDEAPALQGECHVVSEIYDLLHSTIRVS